jgi:NitT/TauT family transport system substrate-binding protein
MTCFKSLFQYAAALMVAAAATSGSAQAETKLRVILDWKYQAQMGMFFLAADRGYFKKEELDVSFDQGEGAGAAAPKVASGAYDIGFGSLDSVIRLQATRPEVAPVAVFQLYNRSPFVIAVRSQSPIKTAKDLEGHTIGGPVFDGALRLFPTFAKMAQIDPSKVKVINMAPNLRAQMLMRGDMDGAFAFHTGIYMDTKLLGANPDKDLRFISYADHGMDLYSNAILVSKALVAEKPEAVKGFLRALNHGIKDAVADPDAAVQSVLKREPLLKAELELQRLKLTFQLDMSGPETATLGLGDVTDARLKKNIEIIVDANKLPKSPEPSQVFNRSLLPPAAERLKKL